MGPANDTESVVNHELKVYGVRGLRVIDASIMPHVPSGNTNAPVIMVGEKGADLVKDYWYSFRKKRSLHKDWSNWPYKSKDVNENYPMYQNVTKG